MSIPLSLYMCLGHGLTMCIFFGYNPQVIFCHFSHEMNLAIFLAKIISSYSFMPVPLKIYTFFSHGLKMGVLFGYNPRTFFLLFSQNELSHFAAKVNRFDVSCVCIISHSFMLIPLKLYKCLGHCLKTCILF